MFGKIRALTCAALFAALPCLAQDPTVRILVGFPPGGAIDVVARLAADKLKSSLGTNVVVENRPGAAGQLAARLLKTAAPDGRTLMLAPPAPIVWAPFTNPDLDYDPQRDFAPVSLAASFDLVLVTGPAMPARDFPGYLDWVRQDPSRATYGTTAPGALPHLLGVLMARSVELSLTHVGYKGGPLLLNDLMGGQISAGIVVFSEAITLHRAGKVRILASSGPARSAQAADVPTFSELGLPALTGGGWMAFYVPARTPATTIHRLSKAIAEALAKPDVHDRLVGLGLDPVGSTPEALASRIADDTRKWRPVVKAAALEASK
jgi:tripartite-type tricarboxylate transporter receptor subunit TctC